MIKISKMADYAVQLLQVLAKHSCLSASKCAKATALTDSTASKILKLLTESHIVTSIQGPKGGYQLVKSADQISLAQVVSAIDGPLALTECVKADYDCAQEHLCGQQKNWQTISQVIFEVLDQISLQDMAMDLPQEKVDVLRYMPMTSLRNKRAK